MASQTKLRKVPERNAHHSSVSCWDLSTSTMRSAWSALSISRPSSSFDGSHISSQRFSRRSSSAEISSFFFGNFSRCICAANQLGPYREDCPLLFSGFSESFSHPLGERLG